MDDPRIHIEYDMFEVVVTDETLRMERNRAITERLRTRLLQIRDGDTHGERLVVRVFRHQIGRAHV